MKFKMYEHQPKMEPSSCPLRPHHKFIPSTFRPEEQTTWGCEACTLTGNPAKYEQYEKALRREQMIEWIFDAGWTCVKDDSDLRWDFVLGLLEHMNNEQLSNVCGSLAE